MTKLKNIIVKGLSISLMLIVSICLFFLIAEGITRILLPQPVSNDSLSRLEGYSIEKSDDTVRILILGDSVAYGWGIKRQETFSKVLEKLLNSGQTKKKFEVINTSIPNINTVHQLNILKNLGALPIYPKTAEKGFVGLDYTPDLILISYSLNDTQQAHITYDEPEFNAMLLGNVQVNWGRYSLPIPQKIDWVVNKKSLFYRFFLVRYDRLLNRLGLRNHLQNILNDYNDNSRGWRDVKNSLSVMSSLSWRNKIKISMFIWPLFAKDMDKNYPFKKIHHKVKTYSESVGIITYDLRETFYKFDGRKFHVAFNDQHPNAEAHRIVAETMHKFIIRNQLLPQ